MKELQVDFQVSYEIAKGFIRATAGGANRGISWNPSVRIISTNIIEQDENEKTGFANTIKTELIFKIECPDDKTCGEIAKNIKDALSKSHPIYIKGLLPVTYESGTTEVKVLNPLSDFLNLNKEVNKK